MLTMEETLSESKPETYRFLNKQFCSLCEEERDFLANAANLVALIYHGLPDLNWVGWYFLKADELVLGPFQGKPACVRIPLGRGVCGTAAARQEPVRVENVHTFPGHIACDTASNSEIVLPLIQAGKLIGVLDLDSPKLNRFDANDQQGLEALVQSFLERTVISAYLKSVTR